MPQIRRGVFYKFANDEDKKKFLQDARIQFPQTCGDIYTHFGFFMSKPALKVNKNGDGICYRSTVDARYFDPKFYIDHNQEVSNMNNTIPTYIDTDYGMTIVDKYVKEDDKTIVDKYQVDCDKVLEDDSVAKAYAAFIAAFKKENPKSPEPASIYAAIGRDHFEAKTHEALKRLEEAKDKKIKNLHEKAYECKVLLSRCKTVDEYKNILAQYGFLRHEKDSELENAHA